MSRLGRVAPGPAEEPKKPTGNRIAAVQMPSRASTLAAPCRWAASARICAVSAKITNTPAWACPARANDFWNPVAGWWPRTIRSMVRPPNSTARMVSNKIPAVVRVSLDRVKVAGMGVSFAGGRAGTYLGAGLGGGYGQAGPAGAY